MSLIHASCIEFMESGLLICGEPGAGKSDLCFRLTEMGARLVADDQTQIENIHGRLIASCPDSLQGLLEVRGLGIIEMPFLPKTQIHLKLSLQTSGKIDRMPEAETEIIEGVKIPVFRLNGFEVSTALKIKTYIQILNGQRKVIR
ncbi:MAG: HPr kinase/phosphatase C-terminal domain-containing protein [Alphaproteobacteria bacterium]|nr:HPr kinase/phosphatase C-terminal domain-containing protein [Alphaproteobacteria bacterium]